MPHEIAVLQDERIEQEVLQPEAGLATAAAEHSSEDPRLPIDTERFAAVSQHGGSMKETLERFRADPNVPLPQCVRNLGFTSVSQLVERIEGTDDPTKRAPTIGELLAAKKHASPQQVAVNPSVNQPKTSDKVRSASAIRSENSSADTSDPIVPSNKLLEQAGVIKHGLKNVAESNEIATESPALSVFEIDSRMTRHVQESEHNGAVDGVEPVDHAHPQALVEEVRAEIDRIYTQSIPGVEAIGTPSKNEAQIDAPYARLEPVVTAEAFGTERLPFIDTQDNNAAVVAIEVGETDNPIFTIDTLGTELERDERSLEIGASTYDAELIREFDAIQAESEATEWGLEVSSDKHGIDRDPDGVGDFRLEGDAVSTHSSAETGDPTSVGRELHTYIDTLEPDRAEVAAGALQALVEVLEVSYRATRQGEEVPDGDQQQIAQLFIELIESLDLTDKDETVKRLLHELFSPEIIAELTKEYTLSTAQRNNMGTYEYAAASPTSLLTGLVQMVTQKLPNLRLGKYALSASMAAT